ncbi:uncharacterized protein F4817DRAFT_315641 [Daldinia loculata]|uniref:uncharacterized protein n=1 Tax=Daldinia loculata TaxID=103429 RepID=UPI0020C27D34|nr:uncharacterized protein F4817DRAFT_315641 [Daldinia loculata]KAI1647773.1 hypothetical protein F4817DRAFT_315641 [Daldinia loculata]
MPYNNNNTNANNTSGGVQPVTPPDTLQSLPYYDPKHVHSNYPPYQVRPAQSLKPANLHTGYVSANQPPGPPKGSTASHFGQRVTAPPPGLAPPAPMAPMGPGLSAYMNPNYASQMPYGARVSPSHHPETMPNSTASPRTPRVVLPPSRGHQHHPNSQTPTRPRTRGKGIGTTSPSGIVPSSRQIITDPRQTVVSSPTFNNYYLPMQARDFQNPYQGKQPQMAQPHIGSPAHAVAPQELKPPLDRHARQRILDEQAKSFSEEDDAAFYPHKD